MKTVTMSIMALMALSIGACTVFRKKAHDAPAPPAPPATPTAALPRMPPSVTSSTGVFQPGNAELAALQMTHKDVTMKTLTEGHMLYTGVCANCHLPKSIYERPEAAWPGILTSMAREANITDAQRDAIYKYVLSIKATQPR